MAEHPLELGLYKRDASLFEGRAGLVAFPRSTAEVVECVQAARRRDVPFVPRGSGTGLAGGSTPLDGALVICLTHMNRIIEIDAANRCAWVEPGVINLDLPDEEVHRRVLARRLCSQCGLDYNLIASRPQVEHACDVCGGALVTRDDDNPESLAVRLNEYRDKTKPVIELFQRKEYVATIDATRAVPDVQASIRDRFHLPRFVS